MRATSKSHHSLPTPSPWRVTNSWLPTISESHSTVSSFFFYDRGWFTCLHIHLPDRFLHLLRPQSEMENAVVIHCSRRFSYLSDLVSISYVSGLHGFSEARLSPCSCKLLFMNHRITSTFGSEAVSATGVAFTHFPFMTESTVYTF